MKIDDIFIDRTSLEAGANLLMIRLLSFVTETEDNFSATNDIKNKIKKRIKIIQKQLYIIDRLIEDELLGESKLDNEVINIEMFNFLDKKEVEDGLRYIITSLVDLKISFEIMRITLNTQNRIKERLKSVYRNIRDIENLYYEQFK